MSLLNLEELLKKKENDEEVKKMYIRLQIGLRKINPKQDPIITLIEMDIIEEMHSDWECNDHERIIEEFDIDEHCHHHCKKHKQEELLCICGKQHIKNITILESRKTGKIYMIGSKCITVIARIASIENNIQLMDKLMIWQSAMQYLWDQKRMKYCVGCFKTKIKKNFNYTDQRYKLRCDNCITINEVHCFICRRFYIHPKERVKKIKGKTYRTFNHHCSKMCKDCFRLGKTIRSTDI